MGLNDLDWNRTGVQRLIRDAEDLASFLNAALSNPDPNERARAMRNGRLTYKELIRRRKNFLLTPVALQTCETLFDQIKVEFRNLRDGLH